VKITPKTEAQISQGGLLPKGEYDFEVVEAYDKKSSAGNEMISLVLHVFDNEGNYHTVFDWLVSTDGAEYKVRHFCATTGTLDKYDAGNLVADDCKELTGKAKIVIKKDKAGNYPDKNGVSDYVQPTDSTAKAVYVPKELDDEIPF
jgi:hypothetical protein